MEEIEANINRHLTALGTADPTLAVWMMAAPGRW
jgi:hypothetical protein